MINCNCEINFLLLFKLTSDNDTKSNMQKHKMSKSSNFLNLPVHTQLIRTTRETTKTCILNLKKPSI